MSIERVDWERYQQRAPSRAQDNPGSSFNRLGDPLRWGGQVRQLVSTGALIIQTTPEFMRAQVADTYARHWSIVGTIDAPNTLWAVVGLAWTVGLEISQGAGQATARQVFDVRGLAAAQLAAGTYLESGAVGRTTRSFSLPLGSVVGRQWTARLMQVLTAGAFVNELVVVTLVAAPLAAGGP